MVGEKDLLGNLTTPQQDKTNLTSSAVSDSNLSYEVKNLVKLLGQDNKALTAALKQQTAATKTSVTALLAGAKGSGFGILSNFAKAIERNSRIEAEVKKVLGDKKGRKGYEKQEADAYIKASKQIDRSGPGGLVGTMVMLGGAASAFAGIAAAIEPLLKMFAEQGRYYKGVGTLGVDPLKDFSRMQSAAASISRGMEVFGAGGILSRNERFLDAFTKTLEAGIYPAVYNVQGQAQQLANNFYLLSLRGMALGNTFAETSQQMISLATNMPLGEVENATKAFSLMQSMQGAGKAVGWTNESSMKFLTTYNKSIAMSEKGMVRVFRDAFSIIGMLSKEQSSEKPMFKGLRSMSPTMFTDILSSVSGSKVDLGSYIALARGGKTVGTNNLDSVTSELWNSSALSIAGRMWETMKGKTGKKEFLAETWGRQQFGVGGEMAMRVFDMLGNSRVQNLLNNKDFAGLNTQQSVQKLVQDYGYSPTGNTAEDKRLIQQMTMQTLLANPLETLVNLVTSILAFMVKSVPGKLVGNITPEYNQEIMTKYGATQTKTDGYKPSSLQAK